MKRVQSPAMRKAGVFLLCACAAVAACRKESGGTTAPQTRVHTTVIPENEARKQLRTVLRPVPYFIDSSALGTQVGTDGAVVTDENIFRPGEPIYLTMRLHESPVGLHTRVKWLDASDKQLAGEQKEMNGAKVVTFVLRQKLKPGKYRAEGYWGGNLAAEKPFEVVAAAPAAKKTKK